MPAWWSRKSSKNKQNREDDDDEEEEQRHGLQFNFMKSPINLRNADNKNKKNNNNKKKPKSFDEIFSRNSPRSSKEFDGGAASERKGLPLPLPTHSADQALGSPSGSGSSLSSSTSFDDHPISPQFNPNNRLIFAFLFYF